MIAKIMHGYSYAGVIKYVFKKEEANYITGNVANQGDHLGKLAGEFIANANQRKSLKKSVTHIAYSPDPRDNMSEQQVLDFIERHMQEMGYNNSLYIIAAHEDTAIKHYHVITSSIDLDGNKVDDKHERIKNLKVCRELEAEFGLNINEYNPDSKKPIPAWQREKGSPQEYIEKAIEMAAATQPSFPDFIRNMQELGVDVKANFAKDQIRLSYKFEDIAVKASDCGGSQKQLKNKYGINYEQQQRDKITQIIREQDQRVQRSEIRDETVSNPVETADAARPSDNESTAQERDPGRVKVGSDVGDQQRYEESKTELRSGLDDTYQRIDSEVQRLYERSAGDVEDAVSVIQSTTENLRRTTANIEEHRQQRITLSAVVESYKNLRSRIIETATAVERFAEQAGKRVWDLLSTRREAERQREAAAQREELQQKAMDLFNEIPERAQRIQLARAKNQGVSIEEYMTDNYHELKAMREKSVRRERSQQLDNDSPSLTPWDR